jgi:hypothetical protein
MSEKLRRLAASSPNPMTIDQLMQALKAMGDQPK